jgi:uncharacterized protein
MFKSIRLAALTLLALVAPALCASTPLPKPTERVVDTTGTLTPTTKAFLTQKLKELADKNGSQIVVYMAPAAVIGDGNMEELTHTSARAWGLGQEGRSNGLVFFIFPTPDRKHGKMRFEVGTGLEGALPDTRCKQIQMNLVAPNFEAGNFDEGVKQGTMALISYAGGEQFGEVTKKVNDAENTTGLTIMLVLIVAGVIVVLFVFGRWLCWPIFSGRGASDNW